MSSCGPITGMSSEVKRRVRPWSSRCDSSRGIAADAALRAAVGKAQERALPGHPDRERGALAERHLRVVADPALRRPEDGGVLDAVAGEDDAAAVVELDRDGEHDRALGVAEALGDRVGDVRVRPRQLELRDRGLEQRRVPLEVRLCSGFFDLRHGEECKDSDSDAGGGSRTRTACEGRPILSRPRLPVPPPRRAALQCCPGLTSRAGNARGRGSGARPGMSRTPPHRTLVQVARYERPFVPPVSKSSGTVQAPSAIRLPSFG